MPRIDLILSAADLAEKALNDPGRDRQLILEALIAQVRHFAAQDASPWPLAEADKVRLTINAEVFAGPDPEDEPGEDYWTFAIDVCGERVLLGGMSPSEVAERVRRA